MTATTPTTSTATMVVDSPAWAWFEDVSSRVIRTEHDAEFYGEYTHAINTAAEQMLAPRLRRAWTHRGAEVVAFVAYADFPRCNNAIHEDTYFDLWREASEDVEFEDLVLAADLMHEYCNQ